MKKKIIILEDQPFIPQRIEKEIRNKFPDSEFEIEIIEVPTIYGDETGQALEELIADLPDSVDLIISDYQAGLGIDFAATTAELIGKNPQAKVIGNSNNYNKDLEKAISDRIGRDFKLDGENSLSKTGNKLMEEISKNIGLKMPDQELAGIH